MHRLSDHAFFVLKRVFAKEGDETALRCYLQEKMVLTQLRELDNIVQLIEFVEVQAETKEGVAS